MATPININTQLSLCCEFLALISGVLFGTWFMLPIRLVLLQVITALFVECFVTFAGLKHRNNMIFYNIYLLIDNFLLLLAARELVSSKKIRLMIIISAAFYLTIWLTVIMTESLRTVSETLFVISFFMITVTFIYVLYISLLNDDRKLHQQPVFWLSIGLILFYGFNTPHFALLRLIGNNVIEKHQLSTINIMVDASSDFRYICTAIFFYTVHRYQVTRKSQEA